MLLPQMQLLLLLLVARRLAMVLLLLRRKMLQLLVQAWMRRKQKHRLQLLGGTVEWLHRTVALCPQSKLVYLSFLCRVLCGAVCRCGGVVVLAGLLEVA